MARESREHGKDCSLEMVHPIRGRSPAQCSKEELPNEIWPDSFVEEANLSAQHIFKLREALGDTLEGERYIFTLPRYPVRGSRPYHHRGR